MERSGLNRFSVVHEKKKKNGIVWLEFELLQIFPKIKHGVFLNLKLGEKDPPENRLKALELFALSKGVTLKQCHQTDIKEIGQYDQNLLHFDGYDGMVTAEKDTGLLIRHADCQATVFYDPVRQVIGNVHCGWRGSVRNIYRKAVDKMTLLYQTNPSDLIVCVGPSLGPNSAEFKHYKQELPETFWKYQTRPTYFDFWEISRMQLTTVGIPEKQIEIAEICTYENEAECFSYRRNKNTSRHGTLVGIVSNQPTPSDPLSDLS
ncbi:MAG: peptidoglycan editing factor PgeF [Chlamydiota bacterium]